MTDMIEKAAEEMRDACRQKSCAVPSKEFAQFLVRITLTALREPTDEMVENGSGHISDDHVLVDEYEKEAKLCWQAMIDAVLHSGKEEK